MMPAVQRSVSRNDPCPCGSGRRYKDCHGSLRGGSGAAAMRKSQYRPAGDDWNAVGEDDSDRLGAMMERALAEQLAERAREAERLYRAVLEEAPLTHDALHMLGVIRLGLGDFTDAERLIKRAMSLRPEYPAIAKNWALVRNAIEARDRRGVEIVSEHALPLLFASLATGDGRERPAKVSLEAGRNMHIVGPALDVAGDGAWLMQRLQALLPGPDRRFWNAVPCVNEGGTWQALDAKVIDTAFGRYPRDGLVVLAGVDCDTDAWLRETIDRVLIFMQPAAPSRYLERLRRIAADGARSLTLVFDSNAKARRFGGDHRILPPPIDAHAYPPVTAGRTRSRSAIVTIVTVGQDRRRVAVADDAEHLLALAKSAGRLELVDPGPLRHALGPEPSVVCVPGNGDPCRFICNADLYLHRIQPWWSEEPRAFFGAMHLGVPVLCHRESIYAEYVGDHVDGWCYDDWADALSIVTALRADRPRLEAAGRAARAKASALFEPRALAISYDKVVHAWSLGQ